MDKIRELMRMARFFLKAFPVVWLASQVLIPCYDYLRPWPFAVDQLNNAGVMLSFCVGLSPATMTQGSQSRTFVAMSRHSVMPRLMTVDGGDGSLYNGAPAWVVAWFVAVVACSSLTWRWWIRPLRANGLEGLRLAI